jgi:hypothetical protein
MPWWLYSRKYYCPRESTLFASRSLVMLRENMFSRLCSAYLCAFVWATSRVVLGAKAPQERWSSYVGDTIWQFSFYAMVFLWIISWPSGLYSVFGRIDSGMMVVFSIAVYLLVVLLHYYFIRFKVGHDFIYQKFSDANYLARGGRIFKYAMGGMLVSAVSITLMLFFEVF